MPISIDDRYFGKLIYDDLGRFLGEIEIETRNSTPCKIKVVVEGDEEDLIQPDVLSNMKSFLTITLRSKVEGMNLTQE